MFITSLKNHVGRSFRRLSKWSFLRVFEEDLIIKIT